jgi:hypothetical protein
MPGKRQNASKWIRYILISGTVVWQIVELATATEAPREAVLLLQYGLLALAGSRSSDLS